jgi:hypothetical protein
MYAVYCMYTVQYNDEGVLGVGRTVHILLWDVLPREVSSHYVSSREILCSSTQGGVTGTSHRGYFLFEKIHIKSFAAVCSKRCPLRLIYVAAHPLEQNRV